MPRILLGSQSNREIICNNHFNRKPLQKLGCGAGAIIDEGFQKETFIGSLVVTISLSTGIRTSRTKETRPSAGEASERIRFFRGYCQCKHQHFDVLLVIDVLEHIPDYMEFVEKCRAKAEYKIFHIPLDIHVSSVLRNAFIGGRYTLGHLHYFTADSAIATLKDTGHEIVDYFYTNAAFGLFKQHPSIKRAIAKGPRWLFSKFSMRFTARVFGGYSLLVLTK
jgi:hypothetical protein